MKISAWSGSLHGWSSTNYALLTSQATGPGQKVTQLQDLQLAEILRAMSVVLITPIAALNNSITYFMYIYTYDSYDYDVLLYTLAPLTLICPLAEPRL